MAVISLKDKANYIRQDTVKVSIANGAGHIAPSLSCIDILTALYYSVMRYQVDNPRCPGRDRMVLSKAHGCYGLYSILADTGLMPSSQWNALYKDGCSLSGCVERNIDYGIEAGCGSLGHGLPLAVGLAYGAMLQKSDWNTYCVVGDGELQEGTAWEAIQFAVKHNIVNLTIIIDANGLQAMDSIENILDRYELECIPRLEGFGLEANVCDGHDAEALAREIAIERDSNRIGLIVAKTIKGYGLKCMENVPKYHYRIPSEEELAQGGDACD